MVIEVKNGNLHKALSIWKQALKDEKFYETWQRCHYYKKPNVVAREKRKQSALRSRYKKMEND